MADRDRQDRNGNARHFEQAIKGFLIFVAILLVAALGFSALGDKDGAHKVIERVPGWGDSM